jgi:hypothetical protein
MPKRIPMVSGQIFKDIKESYTGGSTDMFIPTNVSNIINQQDSVEPIYCYDINSLYPYIMMNSKLPCGKISYFEGDILKLKPDACGFFYLRSRGK